MKYYAVKVGRTTGIFDNWNDCGKSINGFSGAVFASFPTMEEAQAYLDGTDLWGNKIAEDTRNGYVVAFCDGSFDKVANRYSFGVLLIDLNGKETSVCGHGANDKYLATHNIIGEIFGVINALDWAVSNGFEKIKIYHDYEGLSKWVSGEWSANSEVAKMFTAIYRNKFEGVVDVVFEHVKGHSNNKYNDQADELAKSALENRQKIAIQGSHWFALPHFKEEDFKALVALIQEENASISIQTTSNPAKTIHKFELDGKKVVATWFNSKNQKILVQGENSLLFQMIISIVADLEGIDKVETILSSAYRTTIDGAKIDSTLDTRFPAFPADYPPSIKRLIRQAIINMTYYIESEDYSQYAFPALRALEGHIKYLITKAGGTIGKTFTCFNRLSATSPYMYTGTLLDGTKKPAIETCYNYYKAVRDTTFHFGDLIGSTDTTRILETKVEADEIIQKCIQLISEQ